MSTTQLIERARGGDPAAREQLAALLNDRVRRTAERYARRTGMDTEDLRQEMWVGLLLGLQQVDLSIGDPLCYLLLRGKWRLLEAVRRSERERADALEEDSPTLESRGFEEEVCARWLARRLAGRLQGPQRAILEGLLRGDRQEDLARSLGCTAANVSYHVRVIRERFRALAAEN